MQVVARPSGATRCGAELERWPIFQPPHRWFKRISVTLAYLFTWLTIPHVLLHKRRPASALAWVWCIIALPFIGPIAYWTFGADRIQRKRLRKARRLGLSPARCARRCEAVGRRRRARKEELVRTLSVINQVPVSTAPARGVADRCHRVLSVAHGGHRSARHHVHIEFFIWRDDECGQEFLEALIRAARRGVEVRLLLDQIGCIAVSKSVFRPLIEAGGHFSWFYSLPFWRTRAS